jgi:hypothetical protein
VFRIIQSVRSRQVTSVSLSPNYAPPALLSRIVFTACSKATLRVPVPGMVQPNITNRPRLAVLVFQPPQLKAICDLGIAAALRVRKPDRDKGRPPILVRP